MAVKKSCEIFSKKQTNNKRKQKKRKEKKRKEKKRKERRKKRKKYSDLFLSVNLREVLRRRVHQPRLVVQCGRGVSREDVLRSTQPPQTPVDPRHRPHTPWVVCGVVWGGVIWYDVIWYDVIWYDGDEMI